MAPIWWLIFTIVALVFFAIIFFGIVFALAYFDANERRDLVADFRFYHQDQEFEVYPINTHFNQKEMMFDAGTPDQVKIQKRSGWFGWGKPEARYYPKNDMITIKKKDGMSSIMFFGLMSLLNKDADV